MLTIFTMLAKLTMLTMFPTISYQKVMSHGEKELWESGDWRDHVKDLNASFSKVITTMRLVTMLTMMMLTTLIVLTNDHVDNVNHVASVVHVNHVDHVDQVVSGDFVVHEDHVDYVDFHVDSS